MSTTNMNEEIPRLKEMLQDGDSAIRLNAAFTLGRVKNNPGDTVPMLLNALGDVDSTVRAQAAFSLGMLGSSARPAVPKLQQMIDEDDGTGIGKGKFSLKDSALKALGQIEGIPYFLYQLEDYQVEEKWRIAMNMATYLDDNRITDGGEYLPRFVDILSSKDPMVRRYSLKSLACIGAEITEILPVLEKALDDQDSSVRRSVIETLKGLGAQAAALLPRLKMISKKDDHGNVRAAALSAIRLIER